MKKAIINTALLFVCAILLLSGSKSALVAENAKYVSRLQSTEKPLDIVINHIHEGKQQRMSSIHNSLAGSRLAFIFHDGSRIVLNFLKPIRVGNYEIRDRSAEIQAIYYPAGGYPKVLQGYTTIYTLKPITGRIAQLYDADHELHMSSASVFSF
ncbi:hypothetical protein KXQ82_05650 [Mucilaginibacter sp. HMF5004]|uniref:hypothetical protein n=1 Tax=Mucilaginibacter rivuli TaxID=2857527 RepID=UPI001C5EECB0|nr:hypothetical protein [Mucilaginibacter rivuli]MBW4889188.1 hypothetical protein [Mucilaginibacter rivuli]